MCKENFLACKKIFFCMHEKRERRERREREEGEEREMIEGGEQWRGRERRATENSQATGTFFFHEKE